MSSKKGERRSLDLEVGVKVKRTGTGRPRAGEGSAFRLPACQSVESPVGRGSNGDDHGQVLAQDTRRGRGGGKSNIVISKKSGTAEREDGPKAEDFCSKFSSSVEALQHVRKSALMQSKHEK